MREYNMELTNLETTERKLRCWIVGLFFAGYGGKSHLGLLCTYLHPHFLTINISNNNSTQKTPPNHNCHSSKALPLSHPTNYSQSY
jgi:hypothetical protein